TNLAANFDPAFERRIRMHVLFDMPGPEEREQIWRVQMHPKRTPLDPDVNFRAIAGQYPVSGGYSRNAVLNAAGASAAEPRPDSATRLHQRHLEAGITDVVDAERVMQQSLFADKERSLIGGSLLVGDAMSRLLTYALVLGGAALVVALVALTLALLK